MTSKQTFTAPPDDTAATAQLTKERADLLHRLQHWLELPMLLLAFVWLALFVIEIVWRETRALEVAGVAIWVIFLAHFAMELTIAPDKSDYLKHNWLTAVALLVPALRVFRVARFIRLFRIARVGRSVRLVRVVSSVNRGMRALGASLRRRGFGYVVGLSLVVTLAGAAGMFAFEKDTPHGLTTYGESLWWTAMIMTTLGSQYWPATVEGRVLCVLLALYAFAVFGYVAATLATFFIGRDADDPDAEMAGAKQLASIEAELNALRTEIRNLIAQQGRDGTARDR